MTESEWLTSTDPEEMMTALARLRWTRQRPLRLAGCAACRRVWKLMKGVCSREAVEASERFADHLISEAELLRFSSTAKRAWEAIPYSIGNPNPGAAAAAAATYISKGSIGINDLSNAMGAAVEGYSTKRRRLSEEQAQTHLLRDIVGNPFRPVTFAAEWRSDAAIGVASQMYDSREFGNMPILADALQDAGCDHADILDHCREPGPHVRGCWVVDLVLGKE